MWVNTCLRYTLRPSCTTHHVLLRSKACTSTYKLAHPTYTNSFSQFRQKSTLKRFTFPSQNKNKKTPTTQNSPEYQKYLGAFSSLETVEDFNNWMETFALKKDVEKSLLVLQDMKAAALTPDLVTYNILLYVLTQAGEWEQAVHYFNEMRENQIEFNEFSYELLSKLCAATGKYMQLLDILRLMRNKNLRPTVEIYEDIFRYLASADDVAGMTYYYDEMQSFYSLTPSQYICQTLIETLINHQSLQTIIHIINDLDQFSSPVILSLEIYSKILQTFIRAQKILQVYEVLLHLRKCKITVPEPVKIDIDTMLETLIQDVDVLEKFRKLFARMLTSQTKTTNDNDTLSHLYNSQTSPSSSNATFASSVLSMLTTTQNGNHPLHSVQ